MISTICSCSVVVHSKLLLQNLFAFSSLLYLFHIPDHNLCLPVSWDCTGSLQLVIGMEDVVRHVGSPVWEECSMSGMSGVEGMSQGRQNPTRSEPHLWTVTIACPAYIVYFIKVHRCVLHLHLYAHVVASCLSAHTVSSTLTCSFNKRCNVDCRWSKKVFTPCNFLQKNKGCTCYTKSTCSVFIHFN